MITIKFVTESPKISSKEERITPSKERVNSKKHNHRIIRSIKFMDFASSPWWGWLSLGVLVMHTPTVVSAFRQKPIGNDAVDQAMELIERGNFSDAEKRRQYRMLVEKFVNAAVLKQEFQPELNKIEKSLTAEGNTP